MIIRIYKCQLLIRNIHFYHLKHICMEHQMTMLNLIRHKKIYRAFHCLLDYIDKYLSFSQMLYFIHLIVYTRLQYTKQKELTLKNCLLQKRVDQYFRMQVHFYNIFHLIKNLQKLLLNLLLTIQILC